jgi:transposase-like protein
MDRTLRETNGAAPPDPFGSAVADLRAFLAETDREDRRLRHELVVLQAKTKRAKRALDALTADESKASGKPRSQGRRYLGPASEERQQEVIAAMRAGARTVPEIAERMGVSNETARKAVYYLRDIERIRMSGKVQTSPNAPTPATTYALMPGADDGD